MERVRKKRLLYRLLLFILPLLVLSIVATGVILSWASYRYSLKTIDQNYQNIIRSSAGEIRLYMENARKSLEGLALTMNATKLDKWQKEMALTAFSHSAVGFMSISLASTDGSRILTIGREGGPDTFGQSETFKQALGGESAVSAVTRTRENVPYINMAVPVRHLGRVVEVLWGELNLKSVWDVLEGIKVGETGQVFIMEASGRFIGHREIDLVVRAHASAPAGILRELRESDTPVQWVEKSNGARSYCLGYHIPGLNWSVVLSQSYPEIHAYLYQNIILAVFITCLICAATILLGWNRVKRFLMPIQDLHNQVQRIGRGDLDRKVSIESQDEIGDLGLAFNEMTDSLTQFINREVETAKELTHAKNLAVLGVTSSKVAHEVRNLLNNVGLTLSTLKGESLSQRGENALEIIEGDAERVREFIGNFLQFAKRPELHLERASLDSVIQEILMIQRPDADKKGINLTLDWPDDLPVINLDRRLMYQVFNNLVQNSLEAMNGQGEIQIEGRIKERHLVVSLQDTGPGMEPEVVEQIFDPFFTTKGKKGTGLGLSIVQTIVQAHRGTIACSSELDRGTTFTLGLPLQ